MSAPQGALRTEGATPGLRRWRWAVTAAFGLGGITGTAWGPRLPALKASLGLTPAMIGLLLAGVTVGALTGLLSSAFVLHRLGSRRALGAAVLLTAAGLGVMALAAGVGSVPLLAVAFVATGAGIGLLDVSINVEGAAAEQAAGRTLMPMMHAAWSVGAAVGSGIGAACAALGISPAGQFAGEAVLVAAAAAGVAAGIPAGRHAPQQRPGRDRAEAFRHWLRGWTNRRLLLIGLVLLGCELGEGSANGWLPLAARTGHGQSAAVAALFLTVFGGCEAAARIAAGPVVDRLGRVRTTRITTALGVIGVSAFIAGTNEAVVLAGVVLWAFGVSMGFPLGLSAAAESGPDPAAQISVTASIGYFAGIAGPAAIGALAQAAGLLSALWILAVLFLAAFAAAGALRHGSRRAEPA